MSKPLAQVLLDSKTPSGDRLTTLEVRIPRSLQAEFNTHSSLSRNSASSRAIRGDRMLKRVVADTYTPTFGKAGKGMQDHGPLSDDAEDQARQIWLEARDDAMRSAAQLLELGVHKQSLNRLLEPFMWQTVLATATDWANFLNLRCHTDTQPDFQETAHAIGQALLDSTPDLVLPGSWHTPLIQPDELTTMDPEVKRKVSVARCARISYLTHAGSRDIGADLRLYERLLSGGHLSPCEHIARPEKAPGEARGKFHGWVQYRQEIPGESNIHGLVDCPASRYGVTR